MIVPYIFDYIGTVCCLLHKLTKFTGLLRWSTQHILPELRLNYIYRSILMKITQHTHLIFKQFSIEIWWILVHLVQMIFAIISYMIGAKTSCNRSFQEPSIHTCFCLVYEFVYVQYKSTTSMPIRIQRYSAKVYIT